VYNILRAEVRETLCSHTKVLLTSVLVSNWDLIFMPSVSQRAKISGQEILLGRSEISIKGEDTILLGLLNVGLLVFADTLLKEVCLTLKGNHVHPLERILDIVELGYTKSE
jgi:hypothetical protein